LQLHKNGVKIAILKTSCFVFFKSNMLQQAEKLIMMNDE
jgi:hypothetical protein